MIDIHVPEEELVRRILLRGKDSGRADDASEEVIRGRLDVYREQTAVVADYYAGMLVSVQLDASQLRGISSLAQLHACYADHYAGARLVHVRPADAQAQVGGFLAANARALWDGLEILVTGNDERMVVSARFDNLGKGASGAAIQSMNLMLGCDEATGLNA